MNVRGGLLTLISGEDWIEHHVQKMKPEVDLQWPLLRDQLCDFHMVRVGFLLIKLSSDLRSRFILPCRGSGNIFEYAAQKDLQQIWSLSNSANQISLASFSGPFKQ